jgi:N-acetylglucosamine malate deacetylase 1
MNIMVIAPHPDDEVIGCGGTLSLQIAKGDRVSVVFLTSGELGLKHLVREEAWQIRESEAEEAASLLGIGDLHFLRCPDWFLSDHIDAAGAALAPILTSIHPDMLFVPHVDEWHPDHKAALPVVQSAFGKTSIRKPSMLAYEVWTPMQTFDDVRNISAVMDAKLNALQCYRSQLSDFRYDRAVHGLNEYRGALAAKCDYAEVFAYTQF